jgi:hypothetical protein
MSSYSGGSTYAPYTSGSYGANPWSGNSEGAIFQGFAALADATGKSWKNIQEARLIRLDAQRRALDNLKRQWDTERYWNSIRPTAPRMMDAERAVALNDARNRATPARVWSADALNQLLRGIIRNGQLNRGPNIPLDEDTLKHINLTDRSSRGNVGLIKSGGKLNWPPVLQEPPLDKPSKALDRKLREAVEQLKDREPVSSTTLQDIDNLYKELNDRLSDRADELSPSQYIEAKRYLNQVGQAVRALRDKNAVRHFDNSWTPKGKNVAELVDFMRREGLEFAPATEGDESAYNSLYNALRAFEAGTREVATPKEPAKKEREPRH